MINSIHKTLMFMRRMAILALFSFFTPLLVTAAETVESFHGSMDDLFLLRNTKTQRISSFNPNGANKDYVIMNPGESLTIADISGAGIIRRFYLAPFCADRMRYRKLMLRMYWEIGRAHV